MGFHAGHFRLRDGFAGPLKLDQSKVRVITDFMGGGFGSKLNGSVEGVLAARLSREAKAPVRLMLTRFDEALAVGNRPSSFQKIKIGALADGTLHAFEHGQLRHARASAATTLTFPRLTFTGCRTRA